MGRGEQRRAVAARVGQCGSADERGASRAALGARAEERWVAAARVGQCNSIGDHGAVRAAPAIVGQGEQRRAAVTCVGQGSGGLRGTEERRRSWDRAATTCGTEQYKV